MFLKLKYIFVSKKHERKINMCNQIKYYPKKLNKKVVSKIENLNKKMKYINMGLIKIYLRARHIHKTKQEFELINYKNLKLCYKNVNSNRNSKNFIINQTKLPIHINTVMNEKF